MLNKRGLGVIALMCYSTNLLQADSTQEKLRKAHREGQQLAQSFHQQLLTQLPQLKPETIPGFVTTNPKQTELTKTEGNFTQALHNTYQAHTPAQIVKETADKRQHTTCEEDTPLLEKQNNMTDSKSQETLAMLSGLNDFKRVHEGNIQKGENANSRSKGLTTLHLLKEIQDNIRHATDNAHPIEIGKGTLHSIDLFIMQSEQSDEKPGEQRQEYGFFLKSNAFMAEDKLLADKRCYYLGKHYLRQAWGIPLHKRIQFCCFDSEFMRIFHEQGRPFIGLDWGTAENPICRGFTLEELTKIPLEKLNFEEAFQPLLTQSALADKTKLNQTIQTHINQRLETIKADLQHQKTAPQEVSHAL